MEFQKTNQYFVSFQLEIVSPNSIYKLQLQRVVRFIVPLYYIARFKPCLHITSHSKIYHVLAPLNMSSLGSHVKENVRLNY